LWSYKLAVVWGYFYKIKIYSSVGLKRHFFRKTIFIQNIFWQPPSASV
jgi:hypothetical protein